MNTFELSDGVRFVVAVALGLLVGLEREGAHPAQSRPVFGGVRTFPILSMYGFAAAWLYRIGAQLILPVALASVVVLAAIGYVRKIQIGRTGATSEISALLTFLIGAMALLTDIRLAMALGVITTLLLSEKATLESYVERLDKVEFLAVLKFLLVTVIILPVLPDQAYTLYKLNPARIWRIVVLVSSVGFVGYFLTKRFGNRVGLWLSGLMGGIVSSTAVSVAAGRMAQRTPAQALGALQATLLASSVMFLRVTVLIAFLNPAFARPLWWKAGFLALAGVLLAVSVGRESHDGSAQEPPSVENPFEIKTALAFAGLFTVLTVLSGFVRDHFGNAGVLGLAGVVGLVDVDPFLLSLAQDPHAVAGMAGKAVIVALMSNTLVKGVYFSALAAPVRQAALWRYGFWSLLHVPLLWLT